MNAKTKPLESQPSHEQVAALAFELWKKAGQRVGHKQEDWLKAKNQLRSAPGLTGHMMRLSKRSHSPMVIGRSANGSLARP